MFKKISIIAFLVALTISTKAQVREAELVKQVMETIGYNYYDTTYGQVNNWDTLKSHYIQSAFDGKETDVVIEQIFDKIGDPNLRILDPKEFSLFFDEIMYRPHTGSGLAEMMSLEVNHQTQQLKVITPIYNTPAFEAGIRPNDEIVAINDQKVKGMDLEDVMKLLRLETNTPISLLVKRGEEEQIFQLKTEALQPITSPLYKIVSFRKKKIGVIWIPQFTESVSLHFLSVLQKLKKENIDGLVLDLRHNPGGIITEAQSIAGFFIGQKPMAFTQSKNSAIKMIASNSAKIFEQPMTILVNEGTASAAEALTGVLQYYKRATVIGTPTQRKGLIYGFYEVANASTIVMPIGRLKMLDNKDLNTEGITPDIFFETEKPFHLYKSYKKDPMLKFSVQELYDRLKE